MDKRKPALVELNKNLESQCASQAQEIEKLRAELKVASQRLDVFDPRNVGKSEYSIG